METKPAAEPTGPDRGEARAAAANAVAPDPLTADLLAKHSAGEKLTQAEYGKLGAFKTNLKKWFGGKGSAAPGSAQPGPASGNAPAVAAVASVEASDDSLAAVPVDAGICQRTANAVLTRCESIARRVVGNAAREAGATGETLARLDRAASLPKDDRSLIVELAPDVAASLGVNPRHFPLGICLATMTLWGTDLFLAVQDLKAMKEEKKKSETPTTSSTPATPTK